jgi:hypothetical protein
MCQVYSTKDKVHFFWMNLWSFTLTRYWSHWPSALLVCGWLLKNCWSTWGLTSSKLCMEIDWLEGILSMWWSSSNMLSNWNRFRWKHIRRGQICCHIVFFCRGIHVWTSTMVILEHIFPNALYNMLDYNTKNSISKKIPFFNLYCVIPKYICGKKKCHYVLKHANIFKKWLKWILVFMKFIVSIKHCDSIWLE